MATFEESPFFYWWLNSCYFPATRKYTRGVESLKIFERIGTSSGAQFLIILVGMLSGPAAESTFKFLITFNIVGILNLISDIILVLGVYGGGSSSLSSWLELDTKNKANASALARAAVAIEPSQRLGGGNAELEELVLNFLE